MMLISHILQVYKMSGFSHFLLCFWILGYMFCSSRAWYVKMPSNIKGLVDSCLVIPCSFDYNQYPPYRPDRVVWYQYVSQGYPLVYDRWYPEEVIKTFRGRTRLFSPAYKTCSLEISRVKWSDHRQKIYPWVDPENVGKSTYRFFDTTVTIEVVDRAEMPHIMIFGERKVGQPVTVQCTVYHTCPTYPPTLSLNGRTQGTGITHSSMSDGTSRTTLTVTLNIERDLQTVMCMVRHKSGHSETASVTLISECSFLPLTITTTTDEFLEGQPSKVTCNAVYTCPKHIPTFKWNYGSMPTSTDTIKSQSAQWKTVSTLTFTASAKDHGRSLTCSAQFTGGPRQEASITLRVKRNMLSRGWSFTTPSSITGMRGSCIVIPCRFTYSISQPADLQVIWYLFQSNGYPSVFDLKQNVISRYSGITSLIGSVGERNCSLKIERLEMTHNQDRLYPWVDKNPITSYHTLGHTFYDKTSQIIVLEHAQEPQLSITGIPRVGEQSRVSCTVRHTCISAPPILALNGRTGADQIMDTLVSDGIWERKVERIWTVEEEDQSVKCTVSYHGGQTATSELRLNVECPYEKIKMTEKPGEATEGVAKSVICSVSYKCKKNTPTIVWNYKDMQSSLQTRKISSNTYNAVSNLTFIGTLGDDNNSLTCTAQFITGETSDSATIHIKKYEKPVEEVDPHENDTFHVLAADVPFRFSALTRSCVVIPCSFQFQEDVPLTRGIWSKKNGGIVFHNGQSRVLDHFKGRTKILGDLSEGNCTLEIDDIKPFDNGPFCFHAEKGNDKYRFNNSCVFIVMKASPEKPVMTPVPAEVDAGSTITVSCSVTHTCPSHPPVVSWSVPSLTSEVIHTSMQQGIWQTTSTISFMVAGGDGVKNLTCTAISWRDKQQANTVKLTVKGSLMYQLRSSLPVSIPVSILLIAIILAAVFGVFIYRKRKRTDDSPPPRPEKRRSLWDRLSRRYPEGRERPSRPEKRGSIWSRFSRGTRDDGVEWQNERRPRKSFWSRFSRRQDDTVNLNVGYSHNSTAVKCDTQFSKQRFPSPKENRRPPRSARPEDSLYGNI
ncbi:uncharacterized protein LOC118335777 isoform X2 [Morone saxatilis]|uniref:uncharacterized protein LOC118335777 isoform X2 n=1 Tax=Morone saxatilis TaxID=34816 RepID=UPI0015E2105C|nr:uncharacterized protein LOC118335777 isoform X2 [Morone saxatilis]